MCVTLHRYKSFYWRAVHEGPHFITATEERTFSCLD